MQIVANQFWGLISEAKEWLQFVLAHASHHFCCHLSGPFCPGGIWSVPELLIEIFICYPSFPQSPVFWSWRFYGQSGLLSPTGWNWGTCEVRWVLLREKWDSLGRPGVLGVQPMSRDMPMREEEEVTLGRYIGILGRNVGFIYLYSETSKWKLLS